MLSVCHLFFLYSLNWDTFWKHFISILNLNSSVFLTQKIITDTSDLDAPIIEKIKKCSVFVHLIKTVYVSMTKKNLVTGWLGAGNEKNDDVKFSRIAWTGIYHPAVLQVG